MKPNMRWMAVAIFAITLFPITQAMGASDATLEIVEPANMQTLKSSNVWITVQFNFTADSDRKTFYAWLNGKPVGARFHYTESNVARGLLSVADGVKTSVNWGVANIFRAEVKGPDGKKRRKTVMFFVDSSGNHAPVARLGSDQHVFVHEPVALDGSGSEDADGDPLAYRWSFVTVPKQSKAKFSDPSSVTPSFVPDMPGTYVAQLIVDDYKAKSEPKTMTVTVDKLKILVDRPVDDSIFERLSHRATVDQFDGFHVPAGYHVAVLNGDAWTPEELRASRLVSEALVAGMWVLVLNVTEDHKKDSLAPHLGMVSNGQSTAYLFRRFLDGGKPVIRIFNLQPLSMLNVVKPEDIHAETALRYAGILLKTLKESWEGSLPSVASPPPDSPIPDGLINCRWDYTGGLNWVIDYSGRQSQSKGRQQWGSHHVNYTFTLFLDNGGNPTGNKQWLLLQVDGEGNPNDAGSTFLATKSDMDKSNEFAWFQDRFYVDITPKDSFWIWVANDPTSPNPTKTYTANSSFNVGFNMAQGGLGSYSYSSGSNYTLAEWGISCNSSGTHMYWDAHSTEPDANHAYHHDNEWFYTWCDKPKKPNNQSLQQTQYHASVVWRTDTIKNQFANIAAQDHQHLVDTYCDWDWGTTCCGHDGTYMTWSQTTTPTFSLDLGAVVPIDIPAITFSQHPALVGPNGGTIKGSVVLKEPARMDTQILYLASTDTVHANPKTDRVLIKKGFQAASFEIDVNAQGIGMNQLYFATMSGFYAKDYSQQFTMKAVDSGSMYFPMTSPWVDPDWELWGGPISTTGNWVATYQVRYAVSFVDGNGDESPRGPWSDWIGPGVRYPYPGVYNDAMPLLIDIPTDASGKAKARKLYRQFFTNYQKADPNAGVFLITTLNDNTTTTYLDNNP